MSADLMCFPCLTGPDSQTVPPPRTPLPLCSPPVPTVPPGNVHAEATNSTTIRFTWTAPSPQFINGINQGYKVHKASPCPERKPGDSRKDAGCRGREKARKGEEGVPALSLNHWFKPSRGHMIKARGMRAFPGSTSRLRGIRTLACLRPSAGSSQSR